MKKIIILILLVFALIISSCQEDELMYSCNPVINEFVKKNFTVLSQIHVDEFLSYDISTQRAIFLSWDHMKKREAWIEKLNYILNHEPFTNIEKEHIRKLITHIDEDYFLDERIKNEIEFRSGFAREWINTSRNEFGFSEFRIAFIVFSFFKDQAQFEAEVSKLKSINTEAIASSEVDCGCNLSDDYCGIGKCIESDCNSLPSGCGWLWSMPCDGSCY